MNFRPRDSKKVVFNADINGWGYEEVKTVNPFRDENKEYKITLKMTGTAIKVRTYNYNITSSNFAKIKFLPNNSEFYRR